LSSNDFGREERDAMEFRIEHLFGQGLAKRRQRVIFARDLLDTLRRRELEAAGACMSESAGQV